MRICSGMSGVLILLKSFDFDKNFGLYVKNKIIDIDDNK